MRRSGAYTCGQRRHIDAELVALALRGCHLMPERVEHLGLPQVLARDCDEAAGGVGMKGDEGRRNRILCIGVPIKACLACTERIIGVRAESVVVNIAFRLVVWIRGIIHFGCDSHPSVAIASFYLSSYTNESLVHIFSIINNNRGTVLAGQ